MTFIKSFTPENLFSSLSNKDDFLLLDVRNKNDFSRFQIEGPFEVDILNIPYFDFLEKEDKYLSKVSRQKPVKIVCAKEGSAQYVAELLTGDGFDDVSILKGGINTWGNMLVPTRINEKSDKYKLYQFIRPGKASCSYAIIYSGEIVLIDPSRNIHFYKEFAEEQNGKISRVFETHLQADYISGSRLIASEVGAEVFVHPNDFKNAVFSFKKMEDGHRIRIGKDGPEIRAIHTPGHTLGSVSYIVDNSYLISGDTVFINSVGRPDLGGKVSEWSKILYNTLTQKIQYLDENMFLLPGHFTNWTEANKNLQFSEKLGNVKKNNPNIFAIESPELFSQFIEDNMKKQPEIYEKIRKINTGLIDVMEEEADQIDLGKNECAACT